jgi:two-component system, LytTR family, sensor kinase
MINTASLINLLGFSVGIALFSLLAAMVSRYRKPEDPINRLLLAASILGLVWNLGELIAFIAQGLGTTVSPFLLAISSAALGFLPSVILQSTKSKSLTLLSYSFSISAAFLHFYSAIFYDIAPSNAAHQLLGYGSVVLLVGLLILVFRSEVENKFALVTALVIFAFSALHLSSETEGTSWFVELSAHQSSLPLILVILLQNYRFAFADLFLKRAISLLLLSILAFTLYVFVASPILSISNNREKLDAQTFLILLVLWIATALIYPKLHEFAVWLVDNLLLRRIDYKKFRIEVLKVIEDQNDIDSVLNEVCRKTALAFTAKTSIWIETHEKHNRLDSVAFTPNNAEIFVPTTESPYYKIRLQDFLGGRHLLSEELEMLESISIAAARRIDAVRVTHERCEQEIREQEFSKLATEAQLSALRSQINPHFLFNALTTIGYLIQTSPEKAFQTLMRLTKLLRSVLSSATEFCTLGEEIRLIEDYLEIERARFEERLQVEINIPKDLEEIRLPTLILQPLVENAIKHGISKIKEGGKVNISAILKKSDGGVLLSISVVDSGKNFESKNIDKRIGLNNIELRLKSYYGTSASLNIENQPSVGTIAEVTFPVNVAL